MTRVGTHNETNRVAWLERKLNELSPGARILDAGAGEQRFKGLCSHLHYVAQDFAQYDGQGNTRGLQTGTWDQTRLDIVSDISQIPEADASFDAVMCVEVFEHLPAPLLAIREFSRLLKPGGRLILTAPFCSLTHFAPYHFYTGFNRYFFEKHLSENGFAIEELVENGNFFEYVAQEVRRVPFVSESYCKVRLALLDRLWMRLFLGTLSRLSGVDRGSSEMLHFGCFVLATKREVSTA